MLVSTLRICQAARAVLHCTILRPRNGRRRNETWFKSDWPLGMRGFDRGIDKEKSKCP